MNQVPLVKERVNREALIAEWFGESELPVRTRIPGQTRIAAAESGLDVEHAREGPRSIYRHGMVSGVQSSQIERLCADSTVSRVWPQAQNASISISGVYCPTILRFLQS
jgi:hypothetical protein